MFIFIINKINTFYETTIDQITTFTKSKKR